MVCAATELTNTSRKLAALIAERGSRPLYLDGGRSPASSRPGCACSPRRSRTRDVSFATASSPPRRTSSSTGSCSTDIWRAAGSGSFPAAALRGATGDHGVAVCPARRADGQSPWPGASTWERRGVRRGGNGQSCAGIRARGTRSSAARESGTSPGRTRPLLRGLGRGATARSCWGQRANPGAQVLATWTREGREAPARGRPRPPRAGLDGHGPVVESQPPTAAPSGVGRAGELERGVIGAIYAGFEPPSGQARDQLVWATECYARLAALCMSGEDLTLSAALGLGRLRPAHRVSHLRGRRRGPPGRGSAIERRGHRLAVCMIDLDGFKRVNDERGHIEGNRVLSAVGQRAAGGGTPIRHRRPLRRGRVHDRAARDRQRRRRTDRRAIPGRVRAATGTRPRSRSMRRSGSRSGTARARRCSSSTGPTR